MNDTSQKKMGQDIRELWDRGDESSLKGHNIHGAGSKKTVGPTIHGMYVPREKGKGELKFAGFTIRVEPTRDISSGDETSLHHPLQGVSLQAGVVLPVVGLPLPLPGDIIDHLAIEHRPVLGPLLEGLASQGLDPGQHCQGVG
jgi:hypothetical protein